MFSQVGDYKLYRVRVGRADMLGTHWTLSAAKRAAREHAVSVA